MVIVEASYSKKIGLPAYSSHSYSVTIRSEVVDLSQVERESAKLYAILQGSVDRKIQEVGFIRDANGHGSAPRRFHDGLQSDLCPRRLPDAHHKTVSAIWTPAHLGPMVLSLFFAGNRRLLQRQLCHISAARYGDFPCRQGPDCLEIQYPFNFRRFHGEFPPVRFRS
jgi:hypothetical protein